MKFEINTENMNKEFSVILQAMSEIEEMEKEIAEGSYVDDTPYASEIIRNLARRHRKGDNKAKRHLATIYPISTDSIRKTRNGAYIHKGNTCKWDWKHYDNKLSRMEGKRFCREWMPEDDTTTLSTVNNTREIEVRIADLEEELHWNMMELAAAREEVDYYLQECLEISNEIERLRKLL